MTRKIDMEKLCPELAEIIAEIEKVEKYFTPGVEPKAVQNTEVRLTFSEAKTIAATMLELAEENEKIKDALRDYSLSEIPSGGAKLGVSERCIFNKRLSFRFPPDMGKKEVGKILHYLNKILGVIGDMDRHGDKSIYL